MRRLALALALASAALPAQVLQMERRAYARLMGLRAELAASWREADPAQRRALVAALESDARGNPFLPTARALAVARGVTCDERFVFATALHCFALPEVVDPSEFREAHVTLHLPYSVPVPEGVRFELWATIPGEPPQQVGTILENTGQEDLERFRAVAQVPVTALAKATELRARVALGLDPAIPGLEVGAPISVLGDFKARVEALRRARQELVGKVSPRELAVLDGAQSAVERVWNGEPRAGAVPAETDLEVAERIAANLAAQRPALHELAPERTWAGPARITLGLALGPQAPWLASVELLPAGAARKGLLVVLPGTPLWPTHLGGPSSPVATPPGLVHDQLAALRAKALADFRLVVLESPGRVENPAQELAQVCTALRELLGARAAPLLLLAEREGASVATLALTRGARFADAVVLVDGGSLQPGEARVLAEVPVLALAAKGRVTSENLRRLAALAAKVPGAPFDLVETDLLPRDLALVAALDPALAWFAKLAPGATSRPATTTRKGG